MRPLVSILINHRVALLGPFTGLLVHSFAQRWHCSRIAFQAQSMAIIPIVYWGWWPYFELDRRATFSALWIFYEHRKSTGGLSG